ncbi:hypothetical protein Efla_001182 [Eimeria flavescens]
MRLTFVPPAFALSCFITSHTAPGQSKLLLPSMLSGMFFKTNASETPAIASAAAEGADGSDAPSSGSALSAKTSGDLVPKQEVVRELVEAAQQSGPVAPGNEAAAAPTEARAAESEAATEKLVSQATQNGSAVSSHAAADQVGKTVEAAVPVSMEKPEITEEDAVKNSELLQSVSNSAEASWISGVSRESATEALLPLMALTPVLAAAGFHADIEKSAVGASLVRFPSINYAVQVEDLHNYN